MHCYPKLLLPAFLFAALLCIHAPGQDLRVEVKVPNQAPFTGQPFTITLRLTNAGPYTIYDIRMSLSYDDMFFTGEELWFLSTPAEFETSDGFFSRNLTNLPARASVKYSFTAVALRPGEHRLLASAAVGEEVFFGGATFSASQGPGLITLDKPAYIIPETGGGLINVRRLGGDDTTVAVSFATSNGTAIAHSDYVPAAGRLEFGPGELTKTIYIPTIYAPASACNRSLTLRLFNVAGGAFLLRYTNATVTIADPVPLSGYLRPVTVAPSRSIYDSFIRPLSVSADGQNLVFVDRYSVDIDDYGTEIQSSDVVVRNLKTGSSRTLSTELSPYGHDDAVLSGDGKVVAFEQSHSDQELLYSVFARPLVSDSNILVKAGGHNESFESLTLSSNGTMLAYEEWSWDLYETHIFAYDLLTASNELITVSTNGDKANSSSSLLAVNSTGRYVVFQSWADDLVPNDANGWPDIFLRDRQTRKTELISVNGSGLGPRLYPSLGPASISADGRYVMFIGSRRPTVPPEPPGFLTHVFVHERLTRITRRASIEPARTQGEWFNCNFGTMSDDGRFVTYHSFDVRSEDANGPRAIVNVYLTDMQTGDNTLISSNCRRTGGANAPSYWPWISSDGAFVFFFSRASNLIPGEFWHGDTNLFRWERATARTSLVTANMHRTGGVTGDHKITGLSHNGGVLVFSSSATDLVFDDLTWQDEVYVWTRRLPPLSIARINDQITISWPADASPSILECRAPDSDWMRAEGEIQTANGHHVYHAPIQDATGTRFFRLRLL